MFTTPCSMLFPTVREGAPTSTTFPATATDWPMESPDAPFLVMSSATCLRVCAVPTGTRTQTRASKAPARLDTTELMEHLEGKGRARHPSGFGANRHGLCKRAGKVSRVFSLHICA